MTKFGQVQAYDEETGVATIVYARPEACEKCGGCGSQSHTGRICLKADCKIGDWVRVELPDGRFIQAAALAYGLPLAGFLGGLGLTYYLSGQSEGWTLAGGLAGLGLCLLFLKLNERRIARKPEWSPRIAEIYPQKPAKGDLDCAGQP